MGPCIREVLENLSGQFYVVVVYVVVVAVVYVVVIVVVVIVVVVVIIIVVVWKMIAQQTTYTNYRYVEIIHAWLYIYIHYSSRQIWAHEPLEWFVHQYLSLLIIIFVHLFRIFSPVTGEKIHSSVSLDSVSLLSY